jgi:hypothetical protein
MTVKGFGYNIAELFGSITFACEVKTLMPHAFENFHPFGCFE